MPSPATLSPRGLGRALPDTAVPGWGSALAFLLWQGQRWLFSAQSNDKTPLVAVSWYWSGGPADNPERRQWQRCGKHLGQRSPGTGAILLCA